MASKKKVEPPVIGPSEWAYPEDNFTKSEVRYVVQFQINDPSYSHAGRWFDKFSKETLEEGQQMLEEARTRFADSADPYRLVMRSKIRVVSTTILPF